MSDQIKDDDSTCDDTNGIHSQNANITPAEPEKAALEDAPEGDSVEESVSIPSILQDLRVTDALRCMPRIEKIYRKQHMYFAQWQGLRTTPVTEHMEAMKSICRYEASGLQMRGIGLWLLSQILSNCAVHGDGTMTATAGSGDDNDATAYTEEDEQAANSALTEVQINGLMESLLRIAVEQRSTAATTCTSILRLLINRYEVSPTNIFDIGLSIVETFPSVVKVVNYMSLHLFAIDCITTASDTSGGDSTVLGAARFLCALVFSVPHSPITTCSVDRLISVCKQKMAIVATLSANSAADSPQAVHICFHLLHLFSVLSVKFSSARSRIVEDAELCQSLLDFMRDSGEDPEALGVHRCRAAAFRLVEALSMDHALRVSLRNRLSLKDHILSNLERVHLAGFVEAVSSLFIIMWNPELRALRLALDKLKSKASSSPTDVAAEIAQLASYLPAVFEVMDTLQTLINVVLLLTEEAVLAASSDASSSNSSVTAPGVPLISAASAKSRTGRSSRYQEGSLAGRTMSGDGLDDSWTDPSAACVIQSPFYFVNNILYNLNMQLPVYRLLEIGTVTCSLTSAEAASPGKHITMTWSFAENLLKIRALLLLQMMDFANVKLRDVEVADSLIMLVQDLRLPPTVPIAEDSIDNAFHEMSPIIKEHFTATCGPVFDWQGGEEEGSFAAAEYHTHTAGDAAVDDDRSGDLHIGDMCRQLIQKNPVLLRTSVDLWSIDTVDNLSRRLLFVHLILRLGGWDHLQMLGLDLGSIHELAWNLVIDDRLGLEEYPSMQRKCYELMQILEENQIPRSSMNRNDGKTTGDGAIDSVAATAAMATESRMRSDLEDDHTDRRRQRASSQVASFAAPTATTVGDYLISVLSEQDNSRNSTLLSIYRNHIFGNKQSCEDSYLSKDRDAAEGQSDFGQLDDVDPLLIYAHQMQNKKMIYSCFATLMSLGKSERMVRRRLVGPCEAITREVLCIDPIFGQQCVMHVVDMLTEFITRLEQDGEIAITSFIVQALNSSTNLEILHQACLLVYRMGKESPGFIHRCMSRREVELPLMRILCSTLQQSGKRCSSRNGSGGTNEVSAFARDGEAECTATIAVAFNKLQLTAMKACSVLLRDINVHPAWIRSPWAFHWSEYRTGLEERPLLNTRFIGVLDQLLRSCPMPDRMQFFAVALAIGANLMYSCCDGALSDSSSDQSSASLVNALKQAITDTMIRWLPCASRFLISYKKAIKSRTYTRDYDDVKFDFDATVAYEELTGVQHSIDGSKSNSQDLDDESENSIDLKMLAEAMGDGHLDENDSAPETTLGPIDEHSPLKEDDRPSHAGIRLAESTPSGSSVNMLTTVEAAEERRRRIKSKSLGTRALHKIMKTIKHTRTSASPGSPFSTAASKSEHSQDYGTKIGNDGSELAHISTIDFGSEAIEFLTEKLVELEYALFCMDTMFPLANYLQNIQLFERTPVLACMAFYMSENKRNCHIQRRGFDFIKFFADNQIGISSIALQTPAALIHATTMLSETMEVQYSFCNIVSNVIALDEMARENFIRFNVHLLLERMLLRFHSELSRMVCTIIADLAVQDVYVIQLCQHSMLVDCILQLVEAKQEDVRIQVEGLRALQAIFRVPEMLVAKSKNLSTVKVLRRMKKQLQALLRSSEAQPGGYDREVIEGMLAHPLLAKAACSIS